MRFNLKTFAIIIIIILVVSSVYAIYFIIENADNEHPIINSITGNTSGKKGDIVTIHTTFSDNIEVTEATLYYKILSSEKWTSTSILSGSFNISLDSEENLYYYVTVDDEAGNGPIGKPSTDGSEFYTISVYGEDEYTRNVFVEEGSFTNCKYCPIVANMLYELYNSGNYNFYYVTLIRSNEKAADRLDND